MNGSVKLRKNQADKERLTSGPLYLGRPKSWGEFQSSLTAFHSVQGPRKTSTGSPSNDLPAASTRTFDETQEGKAVPAKNVDFPKKSTNTQGSLNVTKSVRSGAFKARPLSEVLLPTPFYRPFHGYPHVEVDTVKSNKNAKPEEEIKTIHESVDIPSLAFEGALEAKSEDESASTFSAETNELSLSHTSDDIRPSAESGFDEVKDKPDLCTASRDQMPEGSTAKLELQDLSLKDANNNSKALSGLTINEPLVTDHKLVGSVSNNVEIVEESSDSAVEACEKISTEAAAFTSNIDSESSSVTDTGFYSPGDKVNQQGFNSVRESEETMGTPTRHLVAHIKSQSGIPAPLHSCYRSNYAESPRLSSSSSKTSFSSMDTSGDEENESLSTYSIQHSEQSSLLGGYDGDRSTEDGILPRPDTKSRNPPARILQTNGFTTKTKTNLPTKPGRKVSESDGADSVTIKIKLSDPSRSAPSSGSLSKRHLGWKDDQNAPVGMMSRMGSVEASRKETPYHGTWPRKALQSQRKKDQKEAEELMRRFRETSEVHRMRFKDIYAESRRKIDEMMFGLRLAMAKNGYGTKFHHSNDVELT